MTNVIEIDPKDLPEKVLLNLRNAPLINNGAPLLCGYHKFKWDNGSVYTGEWRDGMMNGNGEIIFANYASFKGSFINHEYYKGIYINPEGSRYNGYWKNGKLQGEGVIIFYNGVKYNGHFEDGKMSGYGVLTFPGGKQYKGYWKNNRPCSDV